MADSPIGTHNDWKNVKKQFGIPDKVCKFGLGDRIGVFDKAMRAVVKDDYIGEKKLLDAMDLTLRTYAAELAKIKPEKFKGKNAQEQAKSFDGAKKAVATMRTDLNGRLDIVRMAAEPFGELLVQFPKVEQLYNNLDETNQTTVFKFYYRDMRNTLGLPVRRALKLGDKIGGRVLAALKQYEDLLEPLDGMVNNAEDSPDGSPPSEYVHRECAKALNVIRPFIK